MTLNIRSGEQMKTAKKIGKAIKKCRKQERYSQTQLGNKIGVATQTVCKWETGQSVPNFEHILKIADFFNKNLNYFDPRGVEGRY